MTNMKIYTLFVFVILLFVQLSGCENTIESTDNSSQTEVVQVSFTEQLVGTYKRYSEENGKTVMQIYLIHEYLIAEVTEEYAAYYAMEWIPADTYETISKEKSGDFTVYSFSGFSDSGKYFDTVRQIKVALTDTGIEIADQSGEVTVYTRDETCDPIHNPEIYTGFLQNKADNELVGSFSASADGTDVFFQLDSDGKMIWCSKIVGEPIEIYIGVASVDTKAGRIHTMSERLGFGKMPWLYDLEYTLDSSGKLVLKNAASDGLLFTDDAVEFH